ncbi:cutinase family protein [Williamsia herbipolensis]|uniref:cutinase family protein n=1 Tax=Williamsia herbipolensis TaxID=1603258 RepID=UPI001EEF80CD|nr:cutinase family protein [Williamsia herbipolensis]
MFVLAVPGTWETNAKANPAVVPGMLASVTNPLKAAVEKGTPISAPGIAPAQIGAAPTAGMGQGAGDSSGLGSFLGGAATSALNNAAGSTATPSAGSPALPDEGGPHDAGANDYLTNDGIGGTGAAAPTTTSTTTADAPTTSSSGGGLWDAVAPSAGTTAETTTTTAAASAPTGDAASGSIGKSVSFEQVPYVAQVGGPLAGVVKGDPLTLGQSRKAGTDAVSARMKAIAQQCPTAKQVLLGYSQGALIAGDVLSAIGNGKGPVPDSAIIAGGLLSDPARTQTTSNLDSDQPTAQPVSLPGAESFVGPNVVGQGVVGARPDGFGTLADKVTSFCGAQDSICALSGKSKAIAAVVPLLNLRSEDIGPYVTGRALTLLQHVANADPADIQQAVQSVISAVTRISIAAAVNPASLPLELAQVVFASSMLSDIGKVVDMPEYDAFLSLTKPDELATQAVEVASYALLGAHQAYAHTTVDSRGDSATQWLAKWVLGRIESS